MIQKFYKATGVDRPDKFVKQFKLNVCIAISKKLIIVGPPIENYTITMVRDSEEHIDPYNIGWLKLKETALLAQYSSSASLSSSIQSSSDNLGKVRYSVFYNIYNHISKNYITITFQPISHITLFKILQSMKCWKQSNRIHMIFGLSGFGLLFAIFNRRNWIWQLSVGYTQYSRPGTGFGQVSVGYTQY
jgi:hypothetical protein